MYVGRGAKRVLVRQARERSGVAVDGGMRVQSRRREGGDMRAGERGVWGRGGGELEALLTPWMLMLCGSATDGKIIGRIN